MKKKKEIIPLEVHSPECVKENPLCPISGSRHPDVQKVLSNQIIGSMWTKHSDAEEIKQQMASAITQAMGVKPQDALEGMLAAQMVAAHNATMECYRRAMHPDQSFVSRNMNIAHATKLTRSYAALMEALNRYRGKGRQVMRVEHVTVNAGGQAIVGNVTHAPEGGNT